MLDSKPVRIRYYGGKFRAGSLAGKTVSGMKRYFDSSGALKLRYAGLLRPQPSARTVSRRSCNISLARSFINRRNHSSTTFTEIKTNIWTPRLGEGAFGDPTSIPKNKPQWDDGPILAFLSIGGAVGWSLALEVLCVSLPPASVVVNNVLRRNAWLVASSVILLYSSFLFSFFASPRLAYSLFDPSMFNIPKLFITSNLCFG